MKEEAKKIKEIAERKSDGEDSGIERKNEQKKLTIKKGPQNKTELRKKQL